MPQEPEGLLPTWDGQSMTDPGSNVESEAAVQPSVPTEIPAVHTTETLTPAQHARLKARATSQTHIDIAQRIVQKTGDADA